MRKATGFLIAEMVFYFGGLLCTFASAFAAKGNHFFEMTAYGVAAGACFLTMRTCILEGQYHRLIDGIESVERIATQATGEVRE